MLKTIFYSLVALVRKILFSPLENNIHIFVPPCNVLHISIYLYISSIYLYISIYPPYISIYLFSRCLYPDECEQWSASQLLKHSFISPSPLSTYLANDGAPDKLDSDQDQSAQAIHNGRDADDSVGEIPFLCANVVGNSRVKSEFEVLQLLGKGGFGAVVKVSGWFFSY